MITVQMLKSGFLIWCHDNQHNAIQHKRLISDTQHNKTDITLSDINLFTVMLKAIKSVAMLNVVMMSFVALCNFCLEHYQSVQLP
jgi:hypothetical protein